MCSYKLASFGFPRWSWSSFWSPHFSSPRSLLNPFAFILLHLILNTTRPILIVDFFCYLFFLHNGIFSSKHDTVHWNLSSLSLSLAPGIFPNLIHGSPSLSHALERIPSSPLVDSGFFSGTSLQLSGDPSSAEKVYQRALSLAAARQVHTILSNLGNLYRQQKRLDAARTMLGKSLELCPGYAPAHNNLGLVNAVEGRWEEAIACFKRALSADPLLDAAQSNMTKALAISKVNARCRTSKAV